MKNKLFLFVSIIVFFTAVNSYGVPPIKPYDFTAGTTIRSDEVDDNFDEIYNYLTLGPDTLRANAIDSLGEISTSLCSNGQIIKKASGVWACGADSGSGDAITVNSTGADTTGNFKDGDIDWTLTDGGAGGPDDITATVACTGCIDATDLAANSVDSSELVNGSVDAAHLAADVIDETKIADNGIDSEHYNDDSIDDAHINWGTGANQVSCVDLTTTDCGALTSTGLITATGLNASVDIITPKIYNTTGTVTIHDTMTVEGALTASGGVVGNLTGTASDLACTDCVDATDLKDTDSPADEECLTYEATGTTFEWQSCGSGGLATSDIDTSAELDVIVTDNTGSGSLVFNDTAVMTDLTVYTTFTISSSANSTPFAIKNALGNNAVYTYEEADSDVYFTMKDFSQTAQVMLDTEGDNYLLQNTGLGTNSPVHKVDVTGSINVTDIITGPTVIVDLLDASGAVDMDYGSTDVTDHTFITDGTGDGEIVLPNDSIGPAEMAIGAYDLGTSLEADTLTENGNAVSNDAEIEAVVEPLIDTLANLTSVQSLTITLADAGADAFWGWDDTASAYENLTAAEALTVIGGAANDFDGSGDVTIAAADISDQHAGTDITADLEEEGVTCTDCITYAKMADANQMDSKCFWLSYPDDDDDLTSIWRNGTANAFLITEIWGESDQTVNFDLVESAGDCGGPIAPAAGEDEDTGLTCTISADEEIDLKINSVTNSPTWVSICFTGNWVD